MTSSAHAAAARLAAASDLKFALDEIVAQFTRETGSQIEVVYGSSGNFRTQIEQGAPFDMFMSADQTLVFQLADAGLTVDRGVLYAEGRIVLFTPKGSALTPDAELADLKTAIGDGRVSRFAIANPEHAPYGRAAEQALRHAGIWDAIQPRLVLGENVSQAAQFATSGSAEGGIFALSLALSPAVGSLGTYAVIPASYHEPLLQRMVLLKSAGPEVRSFYDHLQQAAARETFRKYGFTLPGEISQ